ncbi:MAG: formyltransferase family protein [Acidobacteriota bacterium]
MGLALTILSDAGHWLEPALETLADEWRAQGHTVRRVHTAAALPHGDLCFMLGCGQIVSPELLAHHTHNLVTHESALPHGRGWSPLTWQVLEGQRQIPVVLFEAAPRVDEGPIYLRTTIALNGNELVDELRAAQTQATFSLCREFVAKYPEVLSHAQAQNGVPSRYPRRIPATSELFLDQTLEEAFDLLRVCDPERYPAFFDRDGQRYYLTLSKEPPCRSR